MSLAFFLIFNLLIKNLIAAQKLYTVKYNDKKATIYSLIVTTCMTIFNTKQV